MRKYQSNVLVRYAIALISVALAFGVTVFVWQLMRPPVAPLFLAAIVITSWLAGRGPAVVATLLSGFILDLFFISPPYQISGGWDDASRILVFTIEGVMLSLLVVSRREISDHWRSIEHWCLACDFAIRCPWFFVGRQFGEFNSGFSARFT